MFAELQELASVLIGQTGGPAGGAVPGGCAEAGQLPLLIIMMGIFYFVMILPARKERKQHQSMLENLKRGDEVVTSSGIFGTVADISPREITLEIAKNVKVRFLRSAISKKAEAPADDKAADKSETAKPAKESKT